MKNRLFEIASKLGEIAENRRTTRLQQLEIQRMIEARKTALIPEGGWPGSNDVQRKAAECKAKESDQVLHDLILDDDLLSGQMAQLEADREALIAERDAYQWTIRDAECVAFGGTSVFAPET